MPRRTLGALARSRGMTQSSILGTPHTRVEGPLKVTGRAAYESDIRLPGMAHAALVLAPTTGTIERLDVAAAGAMPGVFEILTHETLADAVAPVKHAMGGGWANSTWRPLASAEVAYPGQIVALVVAETSEAAAAAAGAVVLTLARRPAHAVLDVERAEPLSASKADHKDVHIGDVEAGLAAAASVVEARYETPIQHHNPMELFSTACAWDGGRLTVHEPSRFVVGLQNGVAAQLGLPADRVRVISRLVGGHFGSRLDLSQHTALVALAAWRLGRPVKLVPTRQAGFTIANHRPDTSHDIRLGADAEGRLTALSHRATVSTSHFDDFAMIGTDVTAAVYACPAIATKERLGRVDRNTPGPMRAPPEVPYLFALESAMDELSHKLGIDPIELRRRNETAVDPSTGKRYTSRPLMRCFDTAAAAFGWQPGPMAPRSLRSGDWLIGHGCASAVRPMKIGPASVRVTLNADCSALVETAHHEIGNGITTLLAMAAADGLGVPVEWVEVRLGDTVLPPAGISGGSSTTTSLINAMDEACGALRRRIAEAAVRGNGALAGADPGAVRFENARLVAGEAHEPIEVAAARLGIGAVSERIDHLPDGFGPPALEKLAAGHTQLGLITGERFTAAFGAQFAEVRVHARTREIRVPRLVGAFAAGRILNPTTARSQMTGGMIWGLGSALLEASEIDPASGNYVNANLADYLVPTSADVPDVEALMVEDDDPQANPAGVKGLGEIGIIGVNAVIANAVFAATGRRVRRLPIRLEDLL